MTMEPSPSVARSARRNMDSFGSTRQSVLGSTRRSIIGPDKLDFSEILAQQNVISGQFHKHDVFFEHSKIQTGEIQMQLAEQQDQLSDIQSQLGELQNQYEIMQRQQERIIDLLERLGSRKSSESTSSGIAEQTAAINGVPAVSSLEDPQSTFAMSATPLTNPFQKLPRPRGRPRKLCIRCKQEKPLHQTLFLCMVCLDLSNEAVVPNRRRRNNKDLTENVKTDNSKRARLEYVQDSRIRIASSIPKDTTRHSPSIPATQQVVQPALTDSTADIPIRTNLPGHDTNPLESSITVDKTPPSSNQPKPWQNPVIEKWSAEIPPESPPATDTIRLAPAQTNHPFFEDSAARAHDYEDIVDPESVDGSSTSSMRSASAATSVAESLPIDEILKSANKNGDPVSATGNRRNSGEKNISPPRLANSQPKMTALGQAPKANMVVKVRRPVPAPSPEGKAKDSHNILVQKIMGTSWRAVNRRF